MANVNKIVDPNKGNPLHKKSEHVQTVLLPTSPGGIVAARTREPVISIQVYRGSGMGLFPKGELYMVLSLYSHVKPDFKVIAPIKMHQRSFEDVDFELGVAFGAMAERLGELYGDNFDPDYVAREGSKKFKELLREMDRPKKG